MENTTGGGIVLYVNYKFHRKEWLDLDVFEERLFESKLCEVALNKK